MLYFNNIFHSACSFSRFHRGTSSVMATEEKRRNIKAKRAKKQLKSVNSPLNGATFYSKVRY
ncbi:hypothetical protein A3781_01425 [Bacillus badius]|nr:hypothetical protein A3781_01425 [Bacillus badius]